MQLMYILIDGWMCNDATNTTVQFLIVEPYRTCKYVIVSRHISVANYWVASDIVRIKIK